jgi:hypothetical protein
MARMMATRMQNEWVDEPVRAESRVIAGTLVRVVYTERSSDTLSLQSGFNSFSQAHPDSPSCSSTPKQRSASCTILEAIGWQFRFSWII